MENMHSEIWDHSEKWYDPPVNGTVPLQKIKNFYAPAIRSIYNKE